MLSRLRSKNLHTWMGGYTKSLLRRLRDPAVGGLRHLLFCFCDHYEPLWGNASEQEGLNRVQRWEVEYPPMARAYRDADGRRPQHSFFFPGEQVTSEFLERLAGLVRGGFGEVEVHLHHDGDTAFNLRKDIQRYTTQLAEHGHLGRDSDDRLRYGFIHGNWCLANSRPDGRWCGVDEELPLLFDTGCYADFTFPSAPDVSQPRIVNQIYWPVGELDRRGAHEQGERARVGHVKRDRILMIQGPLALAKRPGKLAIRIENSGITPSDVPRSYEEAAARAHTWARQRIHIAGRPQWVFVKIYTHGAPEQLAVPFFAGGAQLLHDVLTTQYNDGEHWRLHYVTAREMFNIALAAMEGNSGDPNDFRDFAIAPPPVAT